MNRYYVLRINWDGCNAPEMIDGNWQRGFCPFCPDRNPYNQTCSAVCCVAYPPFTIFDGFLMYLRFACVVFGILSLSLLLLLKTLQAQWGSCSNPNRLANFLLITSFQLVYVLDLLATSHQLD